jgi:tRNA(fMet)-specific endonuclease VapC
MAKRYLLDTSIVIAGIRGHEGVLSRLDKIEPGQLVLSSIVVGELLTGVQKSDHPKQSRRVFDDITQQMGIEPIDEIVAEHYAAVRAALEAQGRAIGVNDTWIAAHGLALGATVVTDNLREFSRVPGLTTENWI